jgi:hypothetical protein
MELNFNFNTIEQTFISDFKKKMRSISTHNDKSETKTSQRIDLATISADDKDAKRGSDRTGIKFNKN